MITSSEKQSDKEVERSFVHLMQMYMFVIEVLQKSKYHDLAPPWHIPGKPQSPSIWNFFSFKCTHTFFHRNLNYHLVTTIIISYLFSGLAQRDWPYNDHLKLLLFTYYFNDSVRNSIKLLLLFLVL